MDSWVDASLLAEAKLREDGLSAALRPAVAEGGVSHFWISYQLHCFKFLKGGREKERSRGKEGGRRKGG